MIDEWGGTLTLTEASSRELMRVLKEQDDEFMDNLFNGKCGFTLKCTDGRSVELVPKADRKTEPNNSKVSEIPTGSTSSKMEQVDKDINVRSKAVYDKWGNVFDARADIDDEPQTEVDWKDQMWAEAVESSKTEPQTDCAWKKGE